MRAIYVQPSDKEWAQYYSQQGSGFIGLPYQRGGNLGSIFRGIFRALFPLAKSAGKAIGKQALRTGAEIASDVVGGTKLSESIKRRGKSAAANLMTKAATKLQEGGRLGKRPNSIKGGPQQKKRITKPRKTQKTKQVDQLGVYYK